MSSVARSENNEQLGLSVQTPSFQYHMAGTPSYVEARQTAYAGNGLFARNTVPAGEEILRVGRPLVAALDSPQLWTTCADCLVSAYNHSQDEGGVKGQGTLKACLGCQVVRYCSKVG